MNQILRNMILGSILLAMGASAYAEVCEGTQTKPLYTPFPGSSRITPAFPDQASRYDNLSFEQHTGDFDALKLTGEFPFARYFSVNLYDFVAASPVAAIADHEIIPDQDHINPYVPGNFRHSDNRSYTLYVVKEGSDFVTPKDANVVEIPSHIENVALMVRVYRPDRGINDQGGVALPTVEALKADGSAGLCPTTGLNLKLLADKIPLLVFAKDLIQTWNVGKDYLGKRLDGSRISDAGLFPNQHNRYIVTPLDHFPFNKAAVVTFTPPTFEDTYEGADSFEGQKDVRYWSLCVGGLGFTSTIDCLVDDEVKRNEDGTVTVVVGNLSIKAMTEKAGLNYLRWGFAYKPLLIHRHMLASENFPERIGNVPALPRPIPLDATDEELDYHSASKWMGEYAPVGKIYSKRAYRRWLRKQ
ncbi:MAG: hypothetical protein MI867_26380 [Pseudomonadales bacterium]|nr:hypothetical protein [Pseudomonadales bacterium]